MNDGAGAWTREQPASGLCVWQPRRGFRYGAEAFWLAGFAIEGGRFERAIDLGTGSGIVAMLLARRALRVQGVDVQPFWREGWERTLRDSQGFAHVAFSTCDVVGLRDLDLGPFDLAVSNPPFFRACEGPRAPDQQRALARTESSAGVADFARVSLALARRVCMVIPLVREADVRAVLSPIRRRVVVGEQRVLLEAGGSAPQEDTVIDERHARTQAWYQLATGARP